MTLIAPNATPNPEASFRELTIQRVSLLRNALLHLFNACGLSVRKSKDLQTHFGVDYTFSWRLYRLLSNDDVLAHCIDIPTASMMQKLYTAAEGRGAPAKLITALQEAFAAFEQHVAHFAGDRDFFAVMVTQIVGGNLEAQGELAHRKAACEAHRYIMGIETDLFHAAYIIHPSSSEAGAFDSAHLFNITGLRRLNAQRPLVIGVEHFSPDAKRPAVPSVEPLDQRSFEKYGLYILPAFCSDPNLPLRTVESPGKVVTEWMSESVGRPSAVDIVQGRVRRNSKFKVLRPTYGCTDPTRLFIQDLIVHRATFGRLEINTTRWMYVGDYSLPMQERSPEHFRAMGFMELSCREQLALVGSGEGAAYTSESPQYMEVLRYASGRLGWNLDDFDVYRLRIEYPLLHSMVHSNAMWRPTES